MNLNNYEIFLLLNYVRNSNSDFRSKLNSASLL
jgi:hypothetical protein